MIEMKKIYITRNLNLDTLVGDMKITDEFYNFLSDHIELYLKDLNELPKIELLYSYLKGEGIKTIAFNFEKVTKEK